MSTTNDTQSAQPQGVQQAGKARRPWWVTLGVIWFVLVGLAGGINAIGQIIQMAGGQVDWAGAAQRAGVQEDLLKAVIMGQAYLQLALSLGLLASSIGMWLVKKWGAVICLIITVLAAAAIILSLVQGTMDIVALIELGSFILIGIGQVVLWRVGRLT
jgi:hypothetical protein